MIRSLRTGVTALQSNQLRLDVIGNNIAGVNTAGFKRSRVLFQDALTQSIATGGRLSGANSVVASHVGNGVAPSAIDTVWSQGALEYTNLQTDLAIAGDGFFIADSPRGNVLTRGGAFTFDADGFLVTPGGLRVQGWQANPDGSINTGAVGDIRLQDTATAIPVQTSAISVEGNLSAERGVGGDPVSMSTVVYDSEGKAHTLVVTMEKVATGDNGTPNDASDDPTAWDVTSAVIAGQNGEPDTALTVGGDDRLTFADGELVSGGAVTIDGTFSDGGTFDVDLDLTALTEYGGSTTASVRDQNGSPLGELIDFGFDQDGQLILAFSNGERRAAAQLAMGSITNPDGLDAAGDGFYETTSMSGDLRIGRAGSEIAAGVISGALESSNVDLAEEFTEMIVAQRGYQASARLITTSDELLQETVQLKR